MFKEVRKDAMFVVKAFIAGYAEYVFDRIRTADPGGLVSLWTASLKEEATHFRDTLRLAYDIRKIVNDTTLASAGKIDEREQHLEYLDRIIIGLELGLISAQSLLEKVNGGQGINLHFEQYDPSTVEQTKMPGGPFLDRAQLKKPPAFDGFNGFASGAKSTDPDLSSNDDC